MNTLTSTPMFLHFRTKETENYIGGDVVIPANTIESIYYSENHLSYMITTADCEYCITSSTFNSICKTLESFNLYLDGVTELPCDEVEE